MNIKPILLSLFLISIRFCSFAQLLDQQLPETDGYVLSLEKSGDTLFFGGTFTKVYHKDSTGKNCGRFSFLSGNLSPVNPFVDGNVNSSVSDDADGFIFGGNFRHCGDSIRNNLARIDTFGNVKTFASGISFNGPVNAMVKVGDTLFVGGEFTSAGTHTLNHTSGGVLSSNMIDLSFPNFTNQVYASVADDKGGWIIAGSFGSVGNQSISEIARMDSLGNVSALNIRFNGRINSLVKYGDTLLIGGQFSRVNDNPFKGLVAYRLSLNTVLNLNWQLNDDVQQLLLDNNFLIIRGSFDSIATIRRFNIARVNLTTAAIDSFNALANNTIRMAGIYNHVLYLTGTFSSVWGQTRAGIAAYNLTTSTITSWNPVTTNPNIAQMTFLANTMYVGGNFASIAGQSRVYLAALDLTTGAVKSWNPIGSTDVFSLLTFNNTIVISYLGVPGKLNNKPIGFAAAVDTVTGTTLKFCPGVDGAITTISVSGNRVFCGGYFTGIGTDMNCKIAAIRISTNTLLPLNANIDGKINTMAFAGNTLYIGGTFKTINTLTRTNIAAFNTTTLALLSWNPAVSSIQPTAEIYNLATSATYLFVTGNYYSIASQLHPGIAAFSIPANTIHSWNPNPSGDVLTVGVINNKLFVSGPFTFISSTSRNKLAVYDLPALTINGTYLPAGPYYNNEIKSWTFHRNKIMMLADFGTAGVIAFDTLLTPDPWAIPITTPINGGKINTISCNGTSVFAGGSFWAGGLNRNNLASAVISTGNVTNWAPQPNNTVVGIASYKQNLYIAGSFTQIAGSPIIGLAKINKSTYVASVEPSYMLNNNIVAAVKQDSSFFFTGYFTSCGSSSRKYLAAINMKKDSVYAWSPGVGFVSNTINSLAVINDTVYVGGFFSVLGGEVRKNIASFKFNRGALLGEITSWCPQPSATVYSIGAVGPHVGIGGLFSYVNGQDASGFAVLTRSDSGTLVKNYLPISGGVSLLKTAGNMLYFNGGDYYRGAMGSIDLTSRQFSGWNSGAQNGCNTALFADGKIFLGIGPASSFHGIERQGLAVLGDITNTLALPVTWFDFSATATSDYTVDLRWTVASQQNCDYYAIERSTTSEPFKHIGTVHNKLGNSSSMVNYSFEDKPMVITDKPIYYRLKQVDWNGTSNYSKTVSVRFDSYDKTHNTINVYPNPSLGGVFSVESILPYLHYSIYDFTGAPIISNAAYHSPMKLYIPLPGLYILKLVDAEGTVSTMKLVVH